MSEELTEEQWRLYLEATGPTEPATRLGDLRDVIALEVDTIANRARYGTYQGCDAETERLIAAIGGEDALIVRGDKP